jgi:hypothetical protein
MPAERFPDQKCSQPKRPPGAGLHGGRVPAAKVTASGVAASASVLRLCGGKETHYGQQDRTDARRPHKEGSSSGHWPFHPEECSSSLLLCGCSRVCDFQLPPVSLRKRWAGVPLSRS